MHNSCKIIITIIKRLAFFRNLLKSSLSNFHLLTLLLLLCLNLLLPNIQANVENVDPSLNLNSSFVAKNYSYFIESLDELAYSDLLVVKALQRLKAKKEIQSSKVVQKYLKDFEQASDLTFKNSKLVELDEFQLKNHAQEISNHVISAYKLILRTAQYWPKLYNTIIPEPDWPVKTLSREEWPSKKDELQAANGIFDSQVFYSFNISEFSEGKIMGISTGVKLSVKQCLDLGLYARRLGYYAQSIEWLQFVQTKLESMKETTGKLSSSNKKLMERAGKYLKKAIDEHDNGLELGKNNMDFWNPKYFQVPLKDLNPSTASVAGKTGQIKATGASFDSFDEENWVPYTKYDVEHYRHFDLCRGKNFQTEDQKSRLFCWQEFHIHKQYLIGPLKMEFLSRDPDLVQIYEALSDSTVEKMKTLVKGNYRTSMCPSIRTDVLEPREGATEEQKEAYRGIQAAYISYITDNDPKNGLESYLKNAEAMSALKLTNKSSAFEIRLVSYTFASVYKLHQDNQARPTANTNQYRFATLLYYLSDVQGGGYTAFPKLGFAAKSIKGSVLLWFNLYGNDEDDDDLVHGTCAPLLGRKYIITKWIKTYDQVQNYPCPLHPKQRFRIKVNEK